ncbi:nickel transport system substrate-binding protein [Hollandina sp. SP2]
MWLAAFLMGVVLLVSGCAKKAETAEKAGETLIMSYPFEPGVINPHTYARAMWIQAIVYDGLTRFKDGKVIPALAERWEISPDGKEYTFYLRKGNVFHDGTPVTASVVKKNFDAVLKHRDNHDWMETANQLQEVAVVDDTTLKLFFDAPFSGVLQELSLARPFRVGAEAIFLPSGDTAEGIAEVVGSGMWVLKEQVEGQYLRFERNDNYWGEKPQFRYLEVRIIPDINTAANSLKAGEINLVYDLEAQMTGDVFNDLKNSGLQIVISNSVNTNNLLLNTARGHTRELAVRQALNHGVDKESIADNIFYGLQIPADTLMPASTPYCDIPLTPYNYDPDKAIALLEGAGWKLEAGAQYRRKNGEELLIRYTYLGDNESARIIGEVLQNQFGKIGVRLELASLDAQTLYENQHTGAFEILMGESWGDPFDPHSYFSAMRNPGHGDYGAQVGLPMKPEIDKAISTALNSIDENEIQDNYAYVLRTLHEQAVYVPLTFSTRQAVFPVTVQSIRFNTIVDIPIEEFRIVRAAGK